VPLPGSLVTRQLAELAFACFLVGCSGHAQVWVHDPSKVSLRVTHDGRTDDLDRGPFVVLLRHHEDPWREALVHRNGEGDIVVGTDRWWLTQIDATRFGPRETATVLRVPFGPSALSLIHEDEGVLRWTACANLQFVRGPELHFMVGVLCDRADPMFSVSTPLSNVVYVDDLTHPLWTLPQTVQVWPKGP
jgi:hypothetical protein